MNESGVYKITNATNGKVYVGSSIHLSVRRREHFKSLRNGSHRNRHLQADWNRDGESSFTFLVIEVCDRDVLLSREQFWIDDSNATHPDHGYNCRAKAIGGPCGITVSPETRRRMSESAKRRSPDHTRRISEALKGRSFTDEWRERISRAKTGVRLSEAQRDRLRKMNIGRKRVHSEATKDIIRTFTILNGMVKRGEITALLNRSTTSSKRRRTVDPSQKFFMVCNTSRLHNHPPRKRYKLLAEAAADAAELSKKFPGQEFFVLEAIGRMHVPAQEGIDVQETVAAASNAVDKPF